MKFPFSLVRKYRDIWVKRIGRILLDRWGRVEITSPRHILVVRWDGKIGDAIVSSFFYREIRKLGNITVSVITTEKLAVLHENGFGADQVITISDKPSYLELVSKAQQLKDVDTIIHPVGYFRTRDLLFTALIKPHNVFALDDEIQWSNVRLKAATEGLYFHQVYTRILNLLGISNVDEKYDVPLLVSNVKQRKHYDIVFNPFGSRADKSIDIARAVTTLTRVAGCFCKATIGILHSPATREAAAFMSHSAALSNVDVIEDISSIDDVIAIIDTAGLVISVDTSIVHIATGLDKPLIAIYPMTTGSFNPWLPKPSASTQVLFSVGPVSSTKDLNHYCDDSLLRAVSALSQSVELSSEDKMSDKLTLIANSHHLS